MANRPKSPVEYIEDPSTGCWVWQRATQGSGYGVVRRNSKTVVATRYVWEKLVGAIPKGLVLDHVKEKCHNTLCVNPAHLEPVTYAENGRRGKLGKLTEGLVKEIRESNESAAVLTARYGLSRGYVNQIRAGTRGGKVVRV